MSNSYYDILGVPKNASEDDIKRAYRKLAFETHPDQNPGDTAAEEQFKLINDAYETLSNPQKRQEYDNPKPNFGFNPFGFEGFNPFGFNFNFSFDRPSPPPIPPHGSQRGRNCEINLEVTPFDIMLNKIITAEYPRLVKCGSCEGHGADLSYCSVCEGHGVKRTIIEAGHQKRVIDSACEECGHTGVRKENQCGNCGGTGLVGTVQYVEIQLDHKWANEGKDHILGMSGFGHFGPYDGPPGDLMVNIHIRFPEDSSISEEAKSKLREAAELIYQQK